MYAYQAVPKEQVLKKKPEANANKNYTRIQPALNALTPFQMQSKELPSSHLSTAHTNHPKPQNDLPSDYFANLVNHTGIPDTTKARFENISGFSFDDVRVHYNSDKPAQLQALAYTQGNQVYIGPGQEKHLGHELGHVIQQKQGKVKPTLQLMGIEVNDELELEKEASEWASQSEKLTKKQEANYLMGDTKKTAQRMIGVIQRVPGPQTHVNALPEVIAPATMNGANVLGDWNNYYGANSTKIHPRTQAHDLSRRVSANATQSIRFGNHERNSFGPGANSEGGFHYHKETWAYDNNTDTMTLGNTLQRITVGTATQALKQDMIDAIGV